MQFIFGCHCPNCGQVTEISDWNRITNKIIKKDKIKQVIIEKTETEKRIIFLQCEKCHADLPKEVFAQALQPEEYAEFINTL